MGTLLDDAVRTKGMSFRDPSRFDRSVRLKSCFLFSWSAGGSRGRRRHRRGGFSLSRSCIRPPTTSIMITSWGKEGLAASTGASSGMDRRYCLHVSLIFHVNI